MNWLLNKLLTWNAPPIKEYFYAGLTPTGNYISGTIKVTGDVELAKIIASTREELQGGALTALNRL